MGMQDKTESISKYLSKPIEEVTGKVAFSQQGLCDDQIKLDGNSANNSKKVLKSGVQTCKSIVKLGLAISVSTISVLFAGQPEKAEATTSPSIVNNWTSESSQSKLSPQGSSVRESKLFRLKRNPLAKLNITQNIYRNLALQLPIARLDRQIKTEKASSFNNSFKVNKSYEQSSSLLREQNSNFSTGELPSNNQLPILLDKKSKEYIFQIPALESNRAQPKGLVESNLKLPVAQDTLTQIYIVKPGDTLNTIAKRYGITRQQIIEANKIQNPHLIFVSQRLKIPQVKAQENFKPTEQSNPNRIVVQNNNLLSNSTQLNLAPQLSELDNSVTENKEETIANPLGMTIKLSASITPKLPPLSSPEQYLPASPAEFEGYIWPARGTLTSGYGWRWGRPHKGVDIAAPIGTPIMAAASGEVISAGWNSGGYGNLVKVKHPNGSVTFYAHNHKIMVRRGQQVKQGQQIAQMGSTGFSTGSHLHFEIRPNGKAPVNPIAYLPKR